MTAGMLRFVNEFRLRSGETREMTVIEAAIFVILPLCLAMAAFTDILTMKIPNRVSVVLAVSFFAVAPFSGMDLATFGWSIVAAVTVFAACFALFAFNVMGGLMMAWAHWQNWTLTSGDCDSSCSCDH